MVGAVAEVAGEELAAGDSYEVLRDNGMQCDMSMERSDAIVQCESSMQTGVWVARGDCDACCEWM